VPLSEELVARARKFDRKAVEAVLVAYHPVVYRIAAALSGRRGLAESIARRVLYRSLAHVGSWKDPAVPARWFHHHTVMASRRYANKPPAAADDALLPEAAPPAYPAYLKALRGLPPQQREAYVLFVGEQLDLRRTAQAMDYSTGATGTHLESARRSLRGLAGDAAALCEATFTTAYGKLTPPDASAVPAAEFAVARYVWPRRIKWVASVLFVSGTTTAIAYGAWRIYPLLDW